MKIPYIVNKNTVVVYTPSKNSLQLVGENIRKLVAENFEWDKDHCPSLKEYCVNAIGKNFENKPILDELPCSDRVYLLDILPIKLPLELMIPLIDDEYYWKRRYHETYGLIKRHLPENWTYKSVYIERHVQQLIEEAQPQYNDEETFDEILDLCSPYVTCLYIEQMQAWKPPLTMEKEDIPEEYPIDHINFWPILRRLPEVEEFHLIYGMNKVGEDFSWRMFKVSVSDCQKLGKALLELKNLKIVRIHRSCLEFKHCQALMQGLIKHKFIEELDLSNCDVGDAGALCIAQYLMDGSSLKTLILANNQIGQIGSEGLGFAILNDNCDTLYDLNLRMNPLGTAGAMGIMRALVRCSKIRNLSFASCIFDEDTPLKVCQMLKLNASLKVLDISSNWFGESGGRELLDALTINMTVESLDLRETDITPEQFEKITEYLDRNKNIEDDGKV